MKNKTMFEIHLRVRNTTESRLFARLSETPTITKEVMRLIGIGLKWERVDANPSYFLPEFQSEKPRLPVTSPKVSKDLPSIKRAQRAFFADASTYKPIVRQFSNNGYEE